MHCSQRYILKCLAGNNRNHVSRPSLSVRFLFCPQLPTFHWLFTLSPLSPLSQLSRLSRPSPPPLDSLSLASSCLFACLPFSLLNNDLKIVMTTRHVLDIKHVQRSALNPCCPHILNHPRTTLYTSHSHGSNSVVLCVTL